MASPNRTLAAVNYRGASRAAQEHPSPAYPWFWEIHTWIEGQTTALEEIDAIQAAQDLASFVRALQGLSPSGGPRGRGIPLAQHDRNFRYWLQRFHGDPAVSAVWQQALEAPQWDGPPVWRHGHLDGRNWLVQNGRICAVIDGGEMGLGDPAADAMVA